MPQSPAEHTGARIAYYRKLRHLTQQGLADRAQVSYSLLTKIEQGVKPASPAIIGALARALAVQTVDLTGQPYLAELQQDELDLLIQPIREALDLYDLGADPDIRPRPVAEIAAEAERLCAAVRATDLKLVAAQLPGLIAESTSAAHEQPSDLAWSTLASTYRTAYDVTTKLGFMDLCVVALDRMDWAAQRASDPVLAAVRQYLRSLVYLRSSQYRTGQRLIRVGMAALDQADASRTRDVARGQLHLGAAVIAARAGDGSAAAEHIESAGRIAAVTGPAEQVYWLSFGPTNVEAHRVSTLAEQDKYAEAVAAAQKIRIPDSWAVSRKSAHIAEVARAQLWIGQPDAALKNLWRARELAPQQMRYHPTVRETVAGLVAAKRSTPGTLHNLASWVGM